MNIRPKAAAIAAIFFGIGILLACFLPSSAIVIIISITMIAVGVCCLKH